MFNYELKMAYWQLLLYGIHVGHSFKNSSLYSGWLVFTFKQNILIINLYKTMLGFKNGYVGFDFCCKFGCPIWFMNLDKAVDLYVNIAAKKCGEFAYTTYWIHGMISNWLHIANAIRKLGRFTEDAHKGQFAKLDMESTPWIFSRYEWPRASLVSSVNTTEFPSQECLITGIPCTGIVDTNISGHISNIPTPGNDDSIDCMVFYNTHISQYILEKKYCFVISWLNSVRKKDRLVNFSNWVLLNFFTKDNKFNKKKILKIKTERKKEKGMDELLEYYLYFKYNTNQMWIHGIKLFFGESAYKKRSQDCLDIYEFKDNSKDNFSLDYVELKKIFQESYIYVGKLVNFYVIKTSWRVYRFIKKKNMSNKVFRLRFLINPYYRIVWDDDYFHTNFFKNRFWRNRFYKTFLRRSKLRSNKFIVKFLKFFYLMKFVEKRGIIDRFSVSFTKVSSFSYIAFNYGINFFKKKIYNSLLNIKNRFNNMLTLKKVNFLYRWLFFKKEIIIFLVKIIYNKNILKNIKFYSMYKVYVYLKNILKSQVYTLYTYFNYYLSFWYLNKRQFNRSRWIRKSFILKKFKVLKKLVKVLTNINLLKKSLISFKRFNYFYLSQYINSCSLNNVINKGLVKHFSLLNLNYNRWLVKSKFNAFLKWKYSKIKKIKKYFRKLLKENRRARIQNRNLNLYRYKYKKFKNTVEAQIEVNKLYKKIKKNHFIKFFFKRSKIKKLRNWQKYNNSSLNDILLLLKKRDKKIFKIYNIFSLKYNRHNFNYYQITKDIYNKNILVDFNFKEKILWDEHYFLNNDLFKKLPLIFFSFFNYTFKKISCKVDKYNIDYYSKLKNFNYIIKFWKLLNIVKNVLRYIKIKFNNIKFWNVDKRIWYYRWRIFKKNKLLLKRRIKRFIRRNGLKLSKIILGHNFYDYFFYNLHFNYRKRYLFMYEGFYFKHWRVCFLRYLFLPRKKRRLYRPSYFVLKKIKLITKKKVKYLIKKNILNYTYFSYIRFINIFQKFFNLKKQIPLGVPFLFKPLRNKYTIYKKNVRKFYWI